jgi:hypothetical protein
MWQFYDGKTQKGLAYFRQVILKRSGRAGIAAIDHKFFVPKKLQFSHSKDGFLFWQDRCNFRGSKSPTKYCGFLGPSF